MSKNNKKQNIKAIASNELKNLTVGKRIFNDGKKYAVAIYMRFGNGDIQQSTSFELQKKYYIDLVSKQKNWDLVDIYCDAGASGTSLKKREQFKRMIDDCTKGERGINLIITKSISRFSRNFIDLTMTIEKLASLNPPIGVYFEIENLYSLDTDCGFYINILNSINGSK